MRFVLIDRLVELERSRRAVASLTLPRAHEIFADHFPCRPLVPGTLLVEAMAQTAGWLIAASADFANWPLLVMVEQGKFRRFAGPDERLTIAAEIQSASEDRYRVQGSVARGAERVATARLIFHAFPLPSGDDAGEAFRRWTAETFAALGGPAASGWRS